MTFIARAVIRLHYIVFLPFTSTKVGTHVKIPNINTKAAACHYKSKILHEKKISSNKLGYHCI